MRAPARQLAVTRTVRLIAIALTALALGACVTTVQPPTAPAQPRAVYLLVHGDHASLVLTRHDARLVRYAYGDWAWYAENRTSPWRGAAALFWPTRATLGRRELAGQATGDNLIAYIREGVDELYRLEVSASAVDALHAELEALFEARRDTLLYNPDFDLEFVTHPQDYTLFHNSNRVVAEWLTRLGCAVDGGHALTEWRVRSPR
jgi:hypothetical protein